MERSEYEKFMDCYNVFETLTRSIISGVVLWEQIQDCQASGTPITEIDVDAAAWEINKRLAAARGEIYAYALSSWAENRYGEQETTEQSENEAADDGGFSVTCYDNST